MKFKISDVKCKKQMTDWRICLPLDFHSCIAEPAPETSVADRRSLHEHRSEHKSF